MRTSPETSIPNLDTTETDTHAISLIKKSSGTDWNPEIRGIEVTGTNRSKMRNGLIRQSS